MDMLTGIPANVNLRKYSSAGILFAYPDGSSIVEFQSIGVAKSIRILATGSIRHRVDVHLLDGASEIQELAQKEFAISPVQPENIEPERFGKNERIIIHLRRLFLEGGRDMMIIETNFMQIKNGKYRIDYIVPTEHYESGKWIFEVVTETLNNQ